MKVFVTKYALSQGILKRDVVECGAGVVKDATERFPAYYHGEGNDWHRTMEDAAARAESMREKKIDSLERQIKKLRRLVF